MEHAYSDVNISPGLIWRQMNPPNFFCAELRTKLVATHISAGSIQWRRQRFSHEELEEQFLGWFRTTIVVIGLASCGTSLSQRIMLRQVLCHLAGPSGLATNCLQTGREYTFRMLQSCIRQPRRPVHNILCRGQCHQIPAVQRTGGIGRGGPDIVAGPLSVDPQRPL